MSSQILPMFDLIDDIDYEYDQYVCLRCGAEFDLAFEITAPLDAVADIQCKHCGRVIRNISFNQKELSKLKHMENAELIGYYIDDE